MIRPLAALVLAVIVGACSGGGATPAPSAAPASAGATGNPAPAASGGAASGGASAGGATIANAGPAGWNRGPYDLAGGSYRLDWSSDGSCTALYFGIVGATNGYRESPPTAGDVALKDMLKGSRIITGVPAGQYFFNVSNVACKKYAASLTPVG